MINITRKGGERQKKLIIGISTPHLSAVNWTKDGKIVNIKYSEENRSSSVALHYTRTTHTLQQF